ncbi:hypothetical protein KAR91_32285 [Candidatus Pacearchaeota archaeon]|nr:hypothetical protein [Candidatus Pacearchaeota archaeon]
MIRVFIGDSEREIHDATPQWINEQINRRRADGVQFCVHVLIDSNPVNLSLTTPGCSGSGGGGGRQPNLQENKVLDLWEKFHLRTNGFTGGNLVAFLKQIS